MDWVAGLGARYDGRVAVHIGCHALRGLGLAKPSELQIRPFDKVRALLAALVRQGVTRVVEVGPGKVLSGLAKRIDKSVETFNVEDRASLEKTIAALKA